jgi:hypothetical protein
MSQIAGKWRVTMATPVGEKTGVLSLEVNGARLQGSLSDGEHHAEISDGRIRGNQLSWSAKIQRPMRLSFKFTAVVEDDNIRGEARHLLGSASFVGKRL